VTVPALRAVDVSKTYGTNPPVHALRHATVHVHHGERLAVVGPSGSGKSTLLNLLGLLDSPTSGAVELAGQDVTTLRPTARDRARAEHIGFVFQDNHVLGHRTVAENLTVKLAVTAHRGPDRAYLIDEALDRVGLGGRRESLGRLLSGGERQRLAVARAIVNGPGLILADEPTGNLDPGNSENVLELFDAQAAAGVAIVVITHDMGIARWADRVVSIVDGQLHPGVPA
jgi:putative ABC transport system ATP-binding protein